MTGKSESWRRLDRIRAASAEPPGRPSPGSLIASAEADRTPGRPCGPSVVEGAVHDSGSAGPLPTIAVARPGRHAARSADDDVAPPIPRPEPEPEPERESEPAGAWLPDDDVEGPVVGAALDRWIARQAAARTAAPGLSVGDVAGSAAAEPSVDGTGPAEKAWLGDGVEVDDDGPGGVLSTPDDPEPPRRPVSRWRAGLRRSVGRRAELWVPESLRGARVDPGRRGAMALLLVAALAAAITAVGVWRDRPEARPVATVSAGSVGLVSADPPQSSPGPSVPGSAPDGIDLATPGSTAPAQIVVSVTGLVRTPGVVTVSGDARVTDAIAAAGGLTDGADVTGLNLAAKLTDGASVVVGAAGASVQGADTGGAASGPAKAGGLVDLNTADADELDTLPGVGPVMAGNIVSWREANGRFTSVDQLQEISGIGPARYAQLSELVTVS